MKFNYSEAEPQEWVLDIFSEITGFEEGKNFIPVASS